MSAPAGRNTGWQITVQLEHEKTFTVSAPIYEFEDNEAEMLRLCDAVTDGLARAGFSPIATVTHEQRVPRV